MNVRDGNPRAGIEQEQGGRSVQLPVEQDHAVDRTERDAVGAGLLLCRCDASKEKHGNEAQKYGDGAKWL
ncbi:MAG TPA: hypothetical protein VJN92_08935 [Candidatus Acidoferrum sp.]|nr:hypothetical protein [Candidatus Acidoferrum sp.]